MVCHKTTTNAPKNEKTLDTGGDMMTLMRPLLLLFLLVSPWIFPTNADSSEKILRVYGPGGPHRAIVECAKLFMERHDILVEVIRALPHDLETRLPQDGDIYYGGAEYMLDDFNRMNPGILNMTTLETLMPRQIGIIVRKGNPLNIRGIADLSREDVDLLDVKLENMRHFYNNPGNTLQNVARLEYTGRQGALAWNASPEIDAWVTYKTWYVSLAQDSEFIEISTDDAKRHLPIVLTGRTHHQQEAMAFISFLKSDAAAGILQKHGWN